MRRHLSVLMILSFAMLVLSSACMRPGSAFFKLLAVFAPPQRFGDQRVGENEPCLCHIVDRQQNVRIVACRRIGTAKPYVFFLRANLLSPK